MKLPILDHDVELEFVDEAVWGGDFADFDPRSLKVRVVKGLPRDVFLPTVLHELVHFKQHVLGQDMNEDEANQLALFMYSLLKNHPRILEKVWKDYTKEEEV